MLKEIIIEKIKKEGPISFRDFMEMALYYPQQGYYTSFTEKIGKKGDFFTSPSFSPVFGALVAKQIEEMQELLQEDVFTIVEYGAGPGHLCRDILAWFQRTNPAAKLNYCIIEKSPAMIAMAKRNVPQEVKWFNSLQEIGPFSGCVLSNELVDNFSVHRVVMRKGLKEIHVDHENDFKEVMVPASAPLSNYLDELKIELPEGYHAEINLQVNAWTRDISATMKKGYVMTIDYGYPSGELMERKWGTLTCFHKHHPNRKPYTNIGKQDITAHVNFSGLCLAGYKNGLEYNGFTDQRKFLSALGFSDLVKAGDEEGNERGNFMRERTLTNTLLGSMGQKFKVLVQEKGIKQKRTLSGARSNL